MNNMKILFISLGCDKNLVDSEHMLGLLVEHGFEITDSEEDAEVIVINTCCFIHDAKEESIQNILEMAKYRTAGSCKVLLVTGCMAERYRDEIIEEIPEVDAVLGTNSYDKILDAITTPSTPKAKKSWMPFRMSSAATASRSMPI